MDTLYWLGEYGKIFCAFAFLMFIWPSVMFSNYLKGKSATYKFSFCVTVQVVLVTGVILLLGVCHILYTWLVVCLFYGSFAVSVFQKVGLRRWTKWLRVLRRFLFGTYQSKSLTHDLWEATRQKLSLSFQRFWEQLRPHIAEYVLLCILVVYGIIYFTYVPMYYYGYGTSDMFVHYQWTDALLDGDIFFAGIYPKGMHCFIYSLHVLSGIKLYNCIQLFGGVQLIVTLIAIYLFLRGILRWRYTPLLVLMLFLTIGTTGADQAFMMGRLQWTLPQEFGLYAEFISALFLFRYLKKAPVTKTNTRLIWNSDLFIFTMAIIAATAIHFYCTIMALLLCLPFILFNIKRFLHLERLLSVAMALAIALGSVAIPMVAAYGAGVPLQGSLRWALKIIQGKEEGEEPEEVVITDAENDGDSEQDTDEFSGETSRNTVSLGEALKRVPEVLYWNGYVHSYKQNGANFFLVMTMVAIGQCVGYRLVWFLPSLHGRRRKDKSLYDSYLPVIAASILFMFIYTASSLGLPQLIEALRLYVTETVLLLTIAAMPVDMLFSLLSRVCRKTVLKVASAMIVVGSYLIISFSDIYHGNLFTQLARYNAEVMVTDSIISNYPPNSYTIVSTTSELYQVNRFGRHEELLRFVNEIDEEEYFLPTEYLFIFVEKRPLEYNQYHFYEGAEWLGNQRYYDYYSVWSNSSLGSEVNASVVTAEAAQADLNDFTGTFEDYSNPRRRTILQSKVYLWCQNFMKLFPSETTVYYEDDDFICYRIQQNPESLYNLAIDNWGSMEGIDWDGVAQEASDATTERLS